MPLGTAHKVRLPRIVFTDQDVLGPVMANANGGAMDTNSRIDSPQKSWSKTDSKSIFDQVFEMMKQAPVKEPVSESYDESRLLFSPCFSETPTCIEGKEQNHLESSNRLPKTPELRLNAGEFKTTTLPDEPTKMYIAGCAAHDEGVAENDGCDSDESEENGEPDFEKSEKLPRPNSDEPSEDELPTTIAIAAAIVTVLGAGAASPFLYPRISEYFNSREFRRAMRKIEEYQIKNGLKLESVKPAEKNSQLTLEKAQTVASMRRQWTPEQHGAFIASMSPQDQWIASQIFSSSENITRARLAELQKEAVNVFALRAYLEANQDLTTRFGFRDRLLRCEVGNMPLEEFKNFFALYERIGVRGQGLTFSNQPNLYTMFKLAQTELVGLPDEVLKDIVMYAAEYGPFHHDLVNAGPADFEEVTRCAKAWAFSPDLSRAVAAKIGTMSVIDKMAAAVARNDMQKNGYRDPDRDRPYTERFWNRFSYFSEQGRESVLLRFGELAAKMPRSPLRQHAYEQLAAEMCPQMSVEDRKLLIHDLESKIDKKTLNPAELLRDLNQKVYQQASKEFTSELLVALRLSLIFKDEKQYEAYRSLKSTNFIVRALPFELCPACYYSGLSDRLLDPRIYTATKAAQWWPSFTDSQKTLPNDQLNQIANLTEEVGSTEPLLDNILTFEQRRLMLATIERHGNLSVAQMRTLVKVVLRQPEILDTIDKNTLTDALKGWEIHNYFPEEIAIRVGQMPSVWHRAAARLAWIEALYGRPTASYRSAGDIERFEKAFQNNVSMGRMSVLLNNGNPLVAAQSLFPTIPPGHLAALATVCMETRAGNNPVEKLIGLSAGAFRDALNELQSPERASDPNHHNNAWKPRAAYGLASTFGKNWRSWLETLEARGVNPHDATHWLPILPPKQLEGLDKWLLRNSDRDLTELQLIANRWQDLRPDQKQLGYKELLTLVKSTKYLNARSERFAIECARWSIPENVYGDLESRYLASLSTPSPFSVKRWQSGNLEGYFLSREDPRGLFLGRHTGCCQHPGGAARTSALHGQESPDGGFFVVVDKRNPDVIVAGSWAWVSDNGGVCFDTIESINVMENGPDILKVYTAAAKELTSTYHTVTVSNEGRFAGLGNGTAYLPQAKSKALEVPSNYQGGYTDVNPNNQLILAENKAVPSTQRAGLEKQSWIRGMVSEDALVADKLAKKIYPEGWQSVPTGSFSVILENRKDGAIGYAVLDDVQREVHDIAVLAEHRSASPVLLRAVLRHISNIGGEWGCSARESTSYALLKLAEGRGLIKIVSATKSGDMNGEAMYDVRFTVPPPPESGGGSNQSNHDSDNRSPKTDRVPPPAGKSKERKAVSEPSEVSLAPGEKIGLDRAKDKIPAEALSSQPGKVNKTAIMAHLSSVLAAIDNENGWSSDERESFKKLKEAYRNNEPNAVIKVHRALSLTLSTDTITTVPTTPLTVDTINPTDTVTPEDFAAQLLEIRGSGVIYESLRQAEVPDEKARDLETRLTSENEEVRKKAWKELHEKYKVADIERAMKSRSRGAGAWAIVIEKIAAAVSGGDAGSTTPRTKGK